MIRDTAGESALELAARRLDRAIAALEQRLSQGANTAEPEAGDLFGEPAHARLTAELDRARAREQELEAAGAEASAALGRAIQEIRAALNGAAPSAEP
ncbi:MAG: hypothetical protein JWQ97_566 [Phenylobacterium sp.]|nr:hypothetical protein [Phenylobacterium sp.]